MKRPDLGAWRKAHARNPIIVRPLRFLRAKLEIGRTEKAPLVWHLALVLPALLWGR